jgi:polysaccharide pyruvyl transferase WcaK-like protein
MAELPIGMRLHAMIPAFGYVPEASISRPTKMNTFLAEYGLPCISLEHLVDAEYLISLVGEVLFDNQQEHLPRYTREIRKQRIHSVRRGLEELVASAEKLVGWRPQGDR